MTNNVALAESVLEALKRVALASGTDVNDLANKAAEEYLAHRHVDELAATGASHVATLGRRTPDPVQAVREIRSSR